MVTQYVRSSARADCWAHCPACDLDFVLPVVVPCPVEVYLAALNTARCPQCGTAQRLEAYSPGLDPRTIPPRKRKVTNGKTID